MKMARVLNPIVRGPRSLGWYRFGTDRYVRYLQIVFSRGMEGMPGTPRDA
jgi:hypothetical protein